MSGKIFLNHAELPTRMVVEPLDLFFLKTTESKPVQEIPIQIRKSPKKVVARSLEYKQWKFFHHAHPSVGMVVEPLDQFFLKTTESKPVQESPAQNTESPKEVVV